MSDCLNDLMAGDRTPYKRICKNKAGDVIDLSAPGWTATLEYNMDDATKVTRTMTITPGTTGEVVFAPGVGQEWVAGTMDVNVALVDFDGKPYTQLCAETLFIGAARP